MMRIAGFGAALLLAAVPALAQTGGTTAPSARPGPGIPQPGQGPTVGGSPSGTSMPPGSGGSTRTPAAVKELLESRGYNRVTDVEETSDGYTATATKGGRETKLMIDRTGRIAEQE